MRLRPGEELPEDLPEPERALAIAAAAGFRLPPGDCGRLAVRRPPPVGALLGPLHRRPYVVLHPGAAVPARRWPAEHHRRAAQLFEQAGLPVVVTGGPGEVELTAAVAGGRSLDLGGRTDLAQFAGVLAGASALVAGNRWLQPVNGDVPGPPAASGLDAAARLARRVRDAGGTVVAAGGSFDELHTGHIATLEGARALGDCLLVLVNSDESVRRRTGSDGPVVPLAERLAALSALDCVDAVAVFDTDDPRGALRALRPDLWVKGGDHDPAELPETPLVRSWGGEVVAVPYRPARTPMAARTRS